MYILDDDKDLSKENIEVNKTYNEDDVEFMFLKLENKSD